MSSAAFAQLQEMLTPEQRDQLNVVRNFLLQDPDGLDNTPAPAAQETTNG